MSDTRRSLSAGATAADPFRQSAMHSSVPPSAPVLCAPPIRADRFALPPRVPDGRNALLIWLLGCAVLLGLPATTQAHEPVFSLGPHTLYQGGFALVGGYDASNDSSGTSHTPNLGILYGITPHLQIAASLPYRITSDVSGIADAGVAIKWRFWRDYGKGWLNSMALQALLKLPSGRQKPGLSTGDAAYGVALTWGYESLRLYSFATAQFTAFDAGLSSKPGNLATGAIVAGGRLWIPEYEDPDLVLLVELLGGWQGGSSTATAAETGASAPSGTAGAPGLRPLHSGGVDVPIGDASRSGSRSFLRWAPEFLLSWRNVMLKSGVLLPVWASDKTTEPDWRVRTSLIIQF